MKEDFLRYFRLENAYTVNHFIHSLHRLPLVKKIVEGKSYDAKGLKILGSIYRIIKKIFMKVLFKALYYAGLVGGSAIILAMTMEEEEELPVEDLGLAFLTVFFFNTLIGTLFNNKLFDVSENSYYAVSLLRVDAGNYARINYGYNLLTDLVPNLLAGLILALVLKFPVYTGLLSAFFVTGAKVAVQALDLSLIDYFHKHQKLETWIKIGLTCVCAFLMLFLVLSGREISLAAVNLVFLAFVILGAFSSIRILTYKDYQRVYKKELSISRNAVETATQTTKAKEKTLAKNSLSEKTISATSSKTGFAYLNDLFMKRHHKSLWGTVRIQLIVIAVVIAGGCILLAATPDAGEVISDMIIKWIPCLMFLMYCLSRGQNFTTCLFVNCDKCLLTYPFFKEPRQILHLFTLRLLALIKLNILPGVLIGAGLDLLYALSGADGDFLTYFVLFNSPIAMSVFFSIHYMMLYYILQPFTEDAEVASVPYKIVNVLTYIVSYFMLQLKVGSTAFGIGAILFCVIYSAVAVVLVYKKAAKTFKIKR